MTLNDIKTTFSCFYYINFGLLLITINKICSCESLMLPKIFPYFLMPPQLKTQFEERLQFSKHSFKGTPFTRERIRIDVELAATLLNSVLPTLKDKTPLANYILRSCYYEHGIYYIVYNIVVFIIFVNY